MTRQDDPEALDVETWSGKGRQDENFPVGSLLVSRKYREPIHCFYAFARNADDIADSPLLSPEEKLARLGIMEDVLLGRRQTGSRSALALCASLARTGVTSRHGADLLTAFRRDATKLRYATMDELYDYCHYSAAPVGRYVLDLHGESHESHAPSDALCIALQILNHLQDCAQDLAVLDRCYLPQALLDHFGASVDQLRQPAESPALRGVFAILLDHVDRLNQAAALLPRIVLDRRLRLETAMIHGLSKRLTKLLRRNDPVAARVKLAKTDFVFSALASAQFLA